MGARTADSAQRTYSRQAAYERGLGDNLSGVANAGLVERQLAQGAAQVQKFGQGEVRRTQRATRQAVGDIQDKIPSTQELARDNLLALVQQRHEEQQATRREKREDLGDRAQDNRQAFHAAMSEAKDLLQLTPKDQMPWSDKSVKNFVSAEDAWLAFEKQIAGKESVDPRAAAAAVARIKQNMAMRSLREGLGNLGFGGFPNIGG
jgi:hypothetical protein